MPCRLVLWGIQEANFPQGGLNPLGCYTRVFSLFHYFSLISVSRFTTNLFCTHAFKNEKRLPRRTHLLGLNAPRSRNRNQSFVIYFTVTDFIILRGYKPPSPLASAPNVLKYDFLQLNFKTKVNAKRILISTASLF